MAALSTSRIETHGLSRSFPSKGKICGHMNRLRGLASESAAASIAATKHHQPNQSHENAPPTLCPRHRHLRSHTSLRSGWGSSSREFPLRIAPVRFLRHGGLSPARVCRLQSLRGADVCLAHRVPLLLAPAQSRAWQRAWSWKQPSPRALNRLSSNVAVRPAGRQRPAGSLFLTTNL